MTFSVGAKGELTFVQKAPAGGLNPRHFSINSAGDLIAVALVNSKKFVVLKRDVKTGKVGDVVAEKGDMGDVTCVIFG